ncbi:hypothetical protein OEZ85_011697 [Tetradesmus obliquus]|uniref:Purple acid phosphatase n=1 Tax=Tetradesmus obliquus TaxID=3088 RepID=A0ABY8TRG5_TETOB|nr:hypothetical protein OEZ85_011697 [Tetradesmus obliquus]
MDQGWSSWLVHLTYWSSTSVLVSWATCDATVADSAPPPPTVNQNSVVLVGPAPRRHTQAVVGVATSYVHDYGKLSQASYASPLLHHVLLSGLTPGATYYYTLGVPVSLAAGAAVGPGPKEYSFKMPRASFPLRIGVMSDPGQTYNTSEMLQHLIASQPSLVMLGGDFTYADTWLKPDEHIPEEVQGPYSYQPKWDTWGRLFEPLLSRVPLIHTNGNHEIEALPDGRRNVAYNSRFPVPGVGRAAPVSFEPVTSSSPYSNLYHAVELPGVLKVISLTSYSPDQEKKGFGSSRDEQYKWLQQELENTDRSVTPWLILLVHAPWYSTYASHFKENDCMREGYEPLVTQYDVDIMLVGHVHAYERTKPVRNYYMDTCGPVHITIGDGGNSEGMNKEFIDTMKRQPDFCDHPEDGKQFPRDQPERCLSWQKGHYCFKEQPDWSAYREPSFGHGTLDLLNKTHATWSWTKNQGGAFNVADLVTIVRGSGGKACSAPPAAAAAASGR